ncbi:MAG: killer suppression protein [Nitrospinota bacterium]|nr:killer suppression protein [Nitrospinota bacterium]
MDISFRNKKLEKELSEEKKLTKIHGSLRAKKIRIRLEEFRVALCLMDFWPPKSGPGRCHELTGNRKGQLSVDLDHPYRLIFVPDHNPMPLHDNEGLDWSKVTSIKIMGIEDTHG